MTLQRSPASSCRVLSDTKRCSDFILHALASFRQVICIFHTCVFSKIQHICWKVHKPSMQMWYATVKTSATCTKLASIPEHPCPHRHSKPPSLPFIGNCYFDFCSSHFLLFFTLVPHEDELINTIAQVSRFVNFTHVELPLYQAVSGFFW